MSNIFIDEELITKELFEDKFDYIENLLILRRPIFMIIYNTYKKQKEFIELQSYKNFTPLLQYHSLLIRIVRFNNIKLLNLMDEYEDGLIDWWRILEISRIYRDEIDIHICDEFEKLAWKGIREREQFTPGPLFFTTPNLFVYMYKEYLKKMENNEYEYRKIYSEIKENLKQKNLFYNGWMEHKESRQIYEKIFYSDNTNTLKQQYINFKIKEKENQAKCVILSIILQPELKDIIKYIIAPYL